MVEGVLAVQGSVLGGWSFHLLADGRLCYVHNLAGWRVVPGRGRPSAGSRRATTRSASGSGRPAAELLVDGEVVGAGEVDAHGVEPVLAHRRRPHRRLVTGLQPRRRDYRGRFAFTGTLHRVDIDVDGLPVVDPEAEAEAKAEAIIAMQ